VNGDGDASGSFFGVFPPCGAATVSACAGYSSSLSASTPSSRVAAHPMCHMAALVRAFYPVGAARRAENMDNRRIRLAPYLSGALYRLTTVVATFILFNSLPIAKREAAEDAWTVIAPNWQVTNAASQKIRVQYSGNLGVVVSV
jgi:hypothetical protein